MTYSLSISSNNAASSGLTASQYVVSLTLSHSFYLHAHKKVEIMTETYAKMEDAYREVCLMFSESPKTVDPSEFFGMFQKFVKAWKVS